MCDTTSTKALCDGKITDFATPTSDEKTEFNICLDCDDIATADGAETNDYGLKVWLYDDPVFDKWVELLDEYGATENEKIWKDSMSRYTLKMECNLTVIGNNGSDGNKSGFGCCLQDLS